MRRSRWFVVILLTTGAARAEEPPRLRISAEALGFAGHGAYTSGDGNVAPRDTGGATALVELEWLAWRGLTFRLRAMANYGEPKPYPVFSAMAGIGYSARTFSFTFDIGSGYYLALIFVGMTLRFGAYDRAHAIFHFAHGQYGMFNAAELDLAIPLHGNTWLELDGGCNAVPSCGHVGLAWVVLGIEQRLPRGFSLRVGVGPAWRLTFEGDETESNAVPAAVLRLGVERRF